MNRIPYAKESYIITMRKPHKSCVGASCIILIEHTIVLCVVQERQDQHQQESHSYRPKDITFVCYCGEQQKHTTGEPN